MKAECGEVEALIQSRADSVAAARHRLADLKLRNSSRQRRLASATAAKLAILDRERARAHPPSHAASQPCPPAPPAAAAHAHERVTQHSTRSASGSTGASGVEVLQLMSSKNKAVNLSHALPGRAHAGPSPAQATAAVLTSSSRTAHAWAHRTPSHGPTGTLFATPPRTPLPLTSFLHRETISAADLREASGSRTRTVDFTGTTAGELLGRCLAEKAAQLGCGTGEVAWFAQASYEAAPGRPVAYSSTLSTPECLASCALSIVTLYLEAALISASLRLPGFTEAEIAGGVAQQGPSAAAAAKRACPYEPASASPAAASAAAPMLGAASSHACMCDTRAAHAPAAAEPELPFASCPSLDPADLWSFSEVEACDSAATRGGDDLMHDAMHAVIAGGTDTASEPPQSPGHLFTTDRELHASCDGCPSLPTPTASPITAVHFAPGTCTAIRCGVDQLCCSRAAARHMLRAVYERYRGWLPRSVLDNLFRASRQYVTRMLGNVLSRGPLDTSADTGRAGQGSGGSGGTDQTPEAEHCRNVPEDAAAAEFSARLGAVAIGLLQNLCRALEEVPAEAGSPADANPDGRVECGGSLGGQGARQALEERMHELITSTSIGCMLSLRHAPRIFWGISASALFPDGGDLEVEELHVKLYRYLQLSRQQKGLYAANWQLWEQRRKANDQHTASARVQLGSLPQSLDLPVTFMRYIAALSAGLPTHTPLDCDKLPGGDGRRLLGADAGDTAAAAAAARALWAMHEADTLILAETLDLQVQPGALLDPLQLAQAFGVHLPAASTPIDFMAICRLAAVERRRGETARLPELCLPAAAVGCVAADCAADLGPERALAAPVDHYTFA